LTTDNYDAYRAQFDPDWDRAVDYHKPKRKPKSKPTDEEIIETLADETSGLEGGFHTTYTPARYEAGFLLDSTRTFFEQALITDILAQVKGGKEASVYRCTAHASTGKALLAAKVYRPRQFRNLRNDKLYREGRDILKADGRPAKKNDHRLMRALNKKTSFGVQAAHTSWLMHEFNTLARLYGAGAAVPEPLASSDNAILMAYVGDLKTAAPTLNEIGLERNEAHVLFDKVIQNIQLMLQFGWIHGDLSAYNILYWDHDVTLIDFPQITNSTNNPHAHTILTRDITRVCDYFSRQGVHCDPKRITQQLWQDYNPINEKDRLADWSMQQLTNQLDEE
jgi:RIO kinase 1